MRAAEIARAAPGAASRAAPGVSRRAPRAARGAARSPPGAVRECAARCAKAAVSAAPTDAASTLTAIYDAINARDVDTAMRYVDDDCLYEDLNFPEPWRGADAVRELFDESVKGIPEDLLFVVDDITGDDLSCGVLWHVELAGVPFPNGRGASFYRLSPESRKLVYARDVVEPPFKPGAAAFVIIRAVAPLVARTLKKAEGGTSDQPDVAAASLSPVGLALGAAAAFYTFALILSPPDMYAPGEPIWMITPETVKEVTDESINFFFVNIFLQDLGIGLQADAHHPVSEGLFNLVNAYSFMFLPVLLRSERSRGMNTYAWWSVQMFLTNAVMMSYLCKRELTLEDRRADPETPKEAGRHALLSKAFGATGGAMGAFCLWWTLAARPELGGDIQARVEHLQYLLGNDRVAFAFAADMVIYSAWQVILIGELDKQRGRAAPAWMRYTPFFGLAGYLIAEEP